MKVKTHLITIEQHDNYYIKWLKSLGSCKPLLSKSGLPTFIITSNKGRLEIETLNMIYLESVMKKHTQPKGKEALTSDTGYIYIKEKDKEVLVGILTHDHVREYAPMFDEIGGNV